MRDNKAHHWIIDDYYLRLTCSAMPEQYNVFFRDTGIPVGYLRIRHGEFTASVPGPGGTEVLRVSSEGDGEFATDIEREYMLKRAVKAIARYRDENPSTGTFTLRQSESSAAIDWKEQARKLRLALIATIWRFDPARNCTCSHPMAPIDGDEIFVAVMSKSMVNEYSELERKVGDLMKQSDEEEKR